MRSQHVLPAFQCRHAALVSVIPFGYGTVSIFLIPSSQHKFLFANGLNTSASVHLDLRLCPTEF